MERVQVWVECVKRCCELDVVSVEVVEVEVEVEVAVVRVATDHKKRVWSYTLCERCVMWIVWEK
jgi:hypothetical protein